MLNGLDLFSGIGGIGIALSPWVRTVAYCEADRYAQAVLLSRIESGEIDCAPIWDDVRTLKGEMLPEIDIIFGGFPCQDVSSAGLRKGMEGERSILYLEAVRLVRECEPQFVFLENVQGIRKFVPSIRGELEAIGYDCRDGFMSAADVGAPHIRQRWWLLANNYRAKHGEQYEHEAQRKDFQKKNNDVADPIEQRLERVGESANVSETNAKSAKSEIRNYFRINDSRWWSAEPRVGRMVHGIPNRTHRIKALGNSVVPIQAREAFKILMGIDGES